jgi:cell division septum initiation protein DivIVA
MTAILIISIIIIIVLVFLWFLNWKKLQTIINDLTSRLTNAEQEKVKLSGQVEDLEQKNIALNKYQGIVDTDQKAKEILADAEKNATSLIDNAKQAIDSATIEANELKSQAQKELDQAAISASTIKTQANIDATSFKKNAISLLNNATTEAQLIIEQANKKAQEIAGDAYKAMQNATELEKTVKAMKNIIEGYGDRYLMPTYSLLDDLAEEFGHTEAGEKLKFSREKTRLMIKNGTSAKCDYVEANRKDTAINFILDAFNGKVDSILSKVKKDNYGTLEQKIKDAYQVVNNNGKAFRNAVITQEYLNTRIDELKWAVIVQELKWQEQEEQRRIKEQIREEEKARRDFEKAMREAQKEEETLKKLIERAQNEIAQASEEQKSKYEERLKELEAKLKIAEDKNQRAISMAQQTKAGNIYIISNIGSFGENVYKIGMTRRLEPMDRVRELGDASVPFEFDVHSMIYSDNAPGLEKELHKKFMRMQMNKVNPRKEFFKVTLADIKAEVDSLNINAKWTMTAEARHYRETVAIETAILNDNQKRLEWEKYQLQNAPVTTVEEDEELDAEIKE